MFSQLSDRRLALLLEHYLDVRGSRLMPRRHDIDALRLGPVLPYIWLSDYEEAHNTFRYRLAGEEVNAVFGARITGLLLSDMVMGERFDAVNELFLRVLNERKVLHAEGPVYRCTDRMTLGERLVLPLSNDGVTADGLVGVTVRGESVDLTTEAGTAEQLYNFSSIEQFSEFSPETPKQRATGGY